MVHSNQQTWSMPVSITKGKKKKNPQLLHVNVWMCPQIPLEENQVVENYNLCPRLWEAKLC